MGREEVLKEVSKTEAQSFSVKRAEVEFHSFASLGEPERAVGKYTEENLRRGALIRNHAGFIGPMSPFVEIGANVGHTSYLLMNEFGEQGFALDISSDALRHGRALMERWRMEREPVRVAGDALHLPFKDNSVRMVLAFQMLSQFQDIEAVVVEVKRILQPGGVFLFSEEPVRRMLTMRLYRAPYWEQMKPWERKLHQWGLLGYLTKDVIGAHQEESFGIRQNHRMKLWDWDRLIKKHFADQRYELFVPRRGWGERVAYKLGQMVDGHGSDWVPARLLGGTLAAICRKEGGAEGAEGMEGTLAETFESLLRCPDCGGDVARDEAETLQCAACGYEAANEEGVYNLLKSEERRELYPGLRQDVIDFSVDGCEDRLMGGFYEVEGVYGNKYRWMSERGRFRLKPVRETQRRLRVRGFAGAEFLKMGKTPRIEVKANGVKVGEYSPDRQGLFVIEMDLPGAEEYEVELEASPAYRMEPDERWFTVNVSLMRLIE